MGPGDRGPGDEQRQQMEDEQRQRMEKEQQERMLKEMKRNIRQMEQGLTMMTRGLKVCTAAKVTVAAEITDGIARMKDTIAKVKSATSAEGLEDLDFSQFAEVGDAVREQVDTCHRVRELPRITKQINRELTQIEREAKRVSAQAKRAKLDLAEQITAITTGIADTRAILVEAAGARTNEALEAVMEKLEGMQDVIQELRETLDTARRIVNLRQGLVEARREIQNAQRQIAAMKRKNVDTTELDALLAEGKQLVSEIETLSKQKPVDVDALVEAFEKLEDLGNRADDAFGKSSGKPEGPRGPNFGRSPADDLKLDAFEQFRGPKEESRPSEGTADIESLLGF